MAAESGEKGVSVTASPKVESPKSELPHISSPKQSSPALKSGEAPTPLAGDALEKGAPETVTFPEGGLRAWLVVTGSWCTLLAMLGTFNSMASFQTYFIEHQLSNYTAGAVGWIFSVYSTLAFAGGIIVGPIFDKHGPHLLIPLGSVGLCLSTFLLGNCQEYWHFLVVFGFLGGTSSSLLFTPAIATIGHYFRARRGIATGIATTSGAIGGILIPLLLEVLLPKVGFAWSTRVLGFSYVCLCAIGCVLIRSRLPAAKNGTSWPDLRIFKSSSFAITVLAVYLVQWAFLVPITYITSYARYSGFSLSFAYQVLMLLNVGSIFGRWVPGLYADIIGRYNTMILTTVLMVVGVLGFWLPAGSTKAGIILFAVTFGFASGSHLTLIPVCIGQLCETKNYGRYYATCYAVVSIGCIADIPIAGEFLAHNGGSYSSLIIFVGACYMGGVIALVVVRVLVTGWKLRVVF